VLRCQAVAHLPPQRGEQLLAHLAARHRCVRAGSPCRLKSDVHITPHTLHLTREDVSSVIISLPDGIAQLPELRLELLDRPALRHYLPAERSHLLGHYMVKGVRQLLLRRLLVALLLNAFIITHATTGPS